MSDEIKPFFYVLWAMHPILEVGIAALMYRRGLLRQFKFFFIYILAQLFTFAVFFPAYVWRSYSAAFYLFWCLNAVSVTCGFLVIHEVFVDVFKSFHTLRDLGTVLFKWAGLVMLLVAGVVSVSTNSSEMPPWEQAIVTSQRCVRIIQIGMVLFLLFFAHYVGVSRRQHSFGMALGFGCFSTVELVLISSWVGNHFSGPTISLLNMIAYNSTLLLWLSYVAIKRPARPRLKTWGTSLDRVGTGYFYEPPPRSPCTPVQNARKLFDLFETGSRNGATRRAPSRFW